MLRLKTFKDNDINEIDLKRFLKYLVMWHKSQLTFSVNAILSEHVLINLINMNLVLTTERSHYLRPKTTAKSFSTLKTPFKRMLNAGFHCCEYLLVFLLII